jgi:hypothetical protein
MCGEQVYAKTDVCIMDIDSELLLLVQEDKSHINPADPEPQLVAEAIAAFQANNFNRVNNLLVEPLPKQVFPKITMVSTFLCFYTIEVTNNLDMCIQARAYHTLKTTVEHHTSCMLRCRNNSTWFCGGTSKHVHNWLPILAYPWHYSINTMNKSVKVHCVNRAIK